MASVLIFDLDGTLLDTLADLTASTNHVLSRHQMPPRTLAEVRTFVGNGVRRLLRLAAPPETDEKTVDTLVAEFAAYYPQHCMDATAPYPGLMEVLQRLKAAGRRLAIVSNKPDYGVQALRQAFFPGLMEISVGEQPGVRRKPAPDAVLRVMEQLHASPEQCVYIGDSDVDVETAKNAGLPFVGVAWGFCGRDALRAFGAQTIADSPRDLLELL